MLENNRLESLVCVLLLVAPLGLSACAADSALSRGSAPEFYDEDPGAPSPDVADDDDDDDDPGSDDDDGAESSGVHLLSTRPEAGSETHLYRDPIRLEFSGYAASALVSVYDADGYSVPAQRVWSEEMSVCELWPTLPFDPASPYRVVISLGDAAIEFGFTTSRVGTPVLPGDVSGQVFALDFSAAQSPDAPKLGSLLQSAASSASWLLRPIVAPAGELSLELAFALPGASGFEQSDCSATSFYGSGTEEFGTLDPGGSYFWTSGGSLSLPVDDRNFVFDSWSLSGDFTPEADAIVGLAFLGDLVADSLGLSTVAEACALAEAEFGSACVPCAGDSVQRCIPLELEGLFGVQTSHNIISQSEVDGEGCDDDISGLLSCSLASEPAGSGSLASLALLFLVGFVRRR